MTEAEGALTDIALRIVSFSALVVNPAHALRFSAIRIWRYSCRIIQTSLAYLRKHALKLFLGLRHSLPF